MSVDNRTTLNDCSAVFTGGDDTGAVISTTGSFYEGGSALSVQFTNSDERSYTTNIGGTRDLSDAQCWLLVKDNLVQTQALGGIKYVLFDGTNEIGYEVGGNDSTGLSLSTFWNSYRLDVSNSAVFTGHAFAGSEASLAKASITGVGYGTQHLSKAVGATDNCQIDRLSFIANGSPALTINGGTSGVPITLTTVSSDDVTNGWGLVSNPQGEQFNIFCSSEWGDIGTASSYFSQSNAQITLIGTDIGVGNFDMSVIANATGTNLFKLDNCVVVNLGAVANWDYSNSNIDTLEINNTQYVDGGTFTFPISGGTSRFCKGTTFVNCGQVNPSTMTFTDNAFIGTTDVNGAMLGNGDVTSQSFTSDSTGHAIYITSIGTYTYTDNSFSGYGSTGTTDAVIYNNSGGAVTINVSSGGTPTYRNGTGATTVIESSVSVSVSAVDSAGLPVEGCSVYMKTAGGTVVLNGNTDASGNLSGSYSGVTPALLDTTVSEVRHSSAAIPYSNFTLGGSISATGYTQTAIMQRD